MSFRSTLVETLGRRILGRPAARFDLGQVRHLPRKTLVPLSRVGLDPVPALGAARERGPVTRLPAPMGLRVWLVTGNEAARAVLSDAGAYSTDFAHLAGAANTANPGGLGFTDPPAHTRLRRLFTPEFTMRRLARLTPRIGDIVHERLDVVAEISGPVDLVREFAIPIPSMVICELLGIPPDGHTTFQQLAMNRFDVNGGATRSLDAISDSLSYLGTVVGQQRRDPGEGLLGMLIREHGDEITDEELVGLADGVLTGGFETTAGMIALGLLVLLRDQQAMSLLASDDGAVAPFVEEALRYLSVVQVAFPRFARHDVVVAGTPIAAGDMVIVSLSGANRDPALGASLESMDPARPPVTHLAFGHGIHRCLGAELARMELRVVYPAFARRFPRSRLAIRPQDLAFRQSSIVYGLERLPVLIA